jgi:MFS family permease
MRRSRILVGLILVPLLALVERFSYYSAKAIFSLFVCGPPSRGGLGLSLSAAGGALAVLFGLGTVTRLVGGAVAVAVDVRRILILGAALAAVAYAALAFATPESLTAIVVLWAVATGLLLSNLFPLAADLLQEARPMTLAALFSVVLIAIDVGSFTGPLVAGLLRKNSFGAPLLVDAMVMALAAGAMTIVLVLDRDRGHDRESEPVAPTPVVPRPAIAVLLLAAAITPQYLISNLSTPELTASRSMTALAQQTGAEVGARLLVVATIIALAAVGSRLPLLIPLGAGLIVAALGGALALAGVDSVAGIVSGTGGQIAEPMALALIAGVAPRRYAPGIFALWITLRLLVTTLSTLGSDVPAPWVIAVGTIGCAAFGAAFLARGRTIEAARFRAPGASPPRRRRGKKTAPAPSPSS